MRTFQTMSKRSLPVLVGIAVCFSSQVSVSSEAIRLPPGSLSSPSSHSGPFAFAASGPGSNLRHQAHCADLFGGRRPASILALDNISIEEFSIGRRIGEGREAQAFATTWNGKPAVLRLFQTVDMKTNEIYKNLTRGQRQALARLDWREANRRVRKLNEESVHGQRHTDFEMAELEQATAIIRLADSRRMQGLRYQGRPIAPAIHALVRNSEGLAVGLVSDYVPGKDLYKLAREGKLSEAQVEEAIQQVIEQLTILGAHGFSHGDVFHNVLVTKGKDQRIIARLIDFETLSVLVRPGQTPWLTDIETLQSEWEFFKEELQFSSGEFDEQDDAWKAEFY
jgi:RIO-like serine/threonine protein kinase